MIDIEEREINIRHLLFSLCKKWKQIIICALIGGFVFCICGYFRGKTEIKRIDEKELLQKEANLASQQDYLENSVIMKNTGLKLWWNTLQIDISVKDDNSNTILKLFETYINAIQSEESYNLIASEIGEKSDYIYELINIANMNKDGEIYTLRDNRNGNKTLSFMIKLLGPDNKYISKIASVLKKYMEKQQIRLTAYPHSIEIYNLGFILSDNDSQERSQIEKRINKLKKEITTINRGKKAYSKWIIIGLLTGVFISIGIYIILYVFSDKLHESGEIESLFGIKTWNTKRFHNDKLKDILVANILTKKDDYNTILATGTAITADLKDIVFEVNTKLEKNIFIVADDLINNPEAIKALSKTNTVLLLEKAGNSKITAIAKEINYLKQNNITIFGCLVEDK